MLLNRQILSNTKMHIITTKKPNFYSLLSLRVEEILKYWTLYILHRTLLIKIFIMVNKLTRAIENESFVQC